MVFVPWDTLKKNSYFTGFTKRVSTAPQYFIKVSLQYSRWACLSSMRLIKWQLFLPALFSAPPRPFNCGTDPEKVSRTFLTRWFYLFISFVYVLVDNTVRVASAAGRCSIVSPFHHPWGRARALSWAELLTREREDTTRTCKPDWELCSRQNR